MHIQEDNIITHILFDNQTGILLAYGEENEIIQIQSTILDRINKINLNQFNKYLENLNLPTFTNTEAIMELTILAVEDLPIDFPVETIFTNSGVLKNYYTN